MGLTNDDDDDADDVNDDDDDDDYDCSERHKSSLVITFKTPLGF